MHLPENLRTLITQDGAIVTDIDQGLMFGMNPIGSLIWQQLTEGRSLDEITQRLAAEFAIPHQQAVVDVNEFFQQLESQHLLSSSSTHDMKPASAIESGELSTFLQRLRTRVRKTIAV